MTLWEGAEGEGKGRGEKWKKMDEGVRIRETGRGRKLGKKGK